MEFVYATVNEAGHRRAKSGSSETYTAKELADLGHDIMAYGAAWGRMEAQNAATAAYYPAGSHPAAQIRLVTTSATHAEETPLGSAAQLEAALENVAVTTANFILYQEHVTKYQAQSRDRGPSSTRDRGAHATDQGTTPCCCTRARQPATGKTSAKTRAPPRLQSRRDPTSLTLPTQS